uniref:Uncharacterized protein n=1 Tax=Tanacetum cinerariifolium TaxID=118510 RepID=A0A6L2KZ95_TANCI|nr:hypothetical protein [Tanacetum cinerariifolium]
MPIPDDLISNNIRNLPYYNAYLEMVTKHDRKVAAEKKGKKKTASKERNSKASVDKPPKPKPSKENLTKTTLPQAIGKGKVVKVRKAKSQFQLVDEPNEEPAHSEPKPKRIHQGKSDEDDMELAIQMSLESFQAQSQAYTGGMAIQEPIVEATRPLPVVEGKDAKTGARSDKTSSGGDMEVLQITKELEEDVGKQENIKEKTMELDQGQDGPEPGRTPKSPPPLVQEVMDEDQVGPDHGESHGALVGQDPKPTHVEFMADLYPKFINDKYTKDESEKPNAEVEVVSMVTVLIYQASSLVPPLSTLITVIDLSPPKLASSTTQAPVFTVTTATTTTPLPPPSQQQSLIESEVYILELRDFSHKIDEVVQEKVKEAVQITLQAPLRDCSKDMSKEDMKEMLHQRMFKNGSYKLVLEHIALYEALKENMEWAQRDEFLAEKDKSCKRRRDDQDPPPPPSETDLCKWRRHVTGTFGSSQRQASQSSAWKNSNTRDAPLSSSKQQFNPHVEQLVEDLPMPETANIPDSEDTDTSYLPKTKQKPECKALATMYQAPAENFLLEKIRDMRTFMHYKESGLALSISKIKDARYLDFGLEQLVPKHMWINDVCIYDISASYDFQLGIESYQKQLNLTKIKWDAKGYEYKHDYTFIDSPCAVVFPVGNNERKIMRFNEIYKFSDGMLTNIMEALDYRVKEFKVNWLNLCMNVKENQEKDKNRIKTGQKQEACRS